MRFGDGNFEGHVRGGEVLQEPWVLGAADAVPDAPRAKAQGIPDAARAGCLARVDRDREALLVGKAERRGEKCRRVSCLVSSEVDPGQRALVPQQAAGLAHRGVRSLVAHDDPDEADLDREPGAGGGVADRLDDVVGVQAGHAGDELWREAQLYC